jgi:hypothetical protein
VKTRVSFFLIFFVLASATVIPFSQLIFGQGLIFYANGLDETSYLQYDYAKLIFSLAGFARVAEFIVIKLHEIGLSGGRINFIFDFFFPVLNLICAVQIFSGLGYSKSDSWKMSFALWVLPALFMTRNPIFAYIAEINKTTNLNFFLAASDSIDIALFRSPEPQFSYFVLCFFCLIAAYFKSLMPIFLAIPFLYPFIAVPLALIIVALQLKKIFSYLSDKTLFATLLSFIFVSLALTVYHAYFVSQYIKTFMVASHLPFISLSFLVNLLLYFLLRRNVLKQHQDILLIACLVPLLTVNTQVFSGWFIQVNNYEQYSGALLSAFMIVLAMPSLSPKIKDVFLCTLISALIMFSFEDFRRNEEMVSRVDLNQDLQVKLQNDASKIAISDLKISSWLNLLYPQQKALFTTFTRTYKTFADQTLLEYLCTRQRIKADEKLNKDFSQMLSLLDQAYAYGHKDFVLYHNSRKAILQAERIIDNNPSNCGRLGADIYFLVANK